MVSRDLLRFRVYGLDVLVCNEFVSSLIDCRANTGYIKCNIFFIIHSFTYVCIPFIYQSVYFLFLSVIPCIIAHILCMKLPTSGSRSMMIHTSNKF